MFDASPAVGIETAPISLIGLGTSLLIGAILSLILIWHYNNFAHVLSNRRAFSRIFPLIILTTLVVITVVKSSLALSLGLVGALSIVRFRTPIKEPEELAYLFIAIAVGLGLGAGQRIATVVAFIAIVVVATAISWRRSSKDEECLYLTISTGLDAAQAETINGISEFVSSRTHTCKIRRIDSAENDLDLTLFVTFGEIDEAGKLVDELRTRWPKASITMIDQTRMPAL